MSNIVLFWHPDMAANVPFLSAPILPSLNLEEGPPSKVTMRWLQPKMIQWWGLDPGRVARLRVDGHLLITSRRRAMTGLVKKPCT